ncbi:MAG: prepilin-type N-terminal cleavage/methylation domain-containing protein [Azoarcus sp.]|jgi:type IV pilus assembly protein PilW|nr:prepilin-type N-terminal cleavage/methylation domain-containing protein [Azoarcus sp.]
MTRFPTRLAAPSIQRGLTLIEMMISMLLGLIVVGGVLGIFVANSETSRRTGDLARIQENARAAVQFMSRSMREAGGNPCGIPPNAGVIIHTEDVSESNWWSGGNDFASSLRGYSGGNSFPAKGSVSMAGGSDAVITVSGNAFAKIVTKDDGSMFIPSGEGLATGDILFACSASNVHGVVFKAGAISKSGDQWQVNRANAFPDVVKSMRATALGKVDAEGWFVGNNGRGGTSLFRAFTGDGGRPEEIAPDVSSMNITYLLPGNPQYVSANDIPVADWPNVIAAYIDLTISKTAAGGQTINRTVGLTVNLRNRFRVNAGGMHGEDSP